MASENPYDGTGFVPFVDFTAGQSAELSVFFQIAGTKRLTVTQATGRPITGSITVTVTVPRDDGTPGGGCSSGGSGATALLSWALLLALPIPTLRRRR